MHDSFINDYLFSWSQISNGIVKFKSFYKLLLRSSVAFISFKEGSAAGSSLHNFHGKVLDVVILHRIVIGHVT